MILNFIIKGILGIVKTILGILPNVPATPTAVSSGGQWIIDQIAAVTSVLSMVYTDTLLTAIIVVILAMYSFEWIYHSTLWLLRKIPMLNIN